MNNIESELERIGLKIKNIRLEKKMTQSGLAAYCDIDIRTIQRIEKGKFNMSLKILYLISFSLKVMPDELLRQDKIIY